MPNFLFTHRSKIPHHFKQVVATLAVSFGPFAAGFGKGYISPALASLQESRNSFTVSAQEGSWIASLSLLGAMFGCLFGGLMLQFGRRMSLLIVALPFSGSWLLAVFATRIEFMYSTSFIGGFCSAIILLATQVYVSEISHPEIRGSLSSLMKIAGHLGTLASFSLGAFLDWRELAKVAAIGPIILFLAILPIPETPSFLLYHGRDEEASESLAWLRSKGEDVGGELETLRVNIKSKRKGFLPPGCSTYLTRLLIITCGLMFFTKFSGVTVFSFYAVPIFKQMFIRPLSSLPDAHGITVLQSVNDTDTYMVLNETLNNPIQSDTISINVFGLSLNPHGAAVAFVLLQLVGSLTSGLLIDNVGRLPLLTLSSLVISGSFLGLGLFSWMEEYLFQLGFAQSLDWIPLTCVLFFTLFFSIGIGPISWLMACELFPLEYRNFGSAVSTSFSYVCAFASVKTYVDIKNQIGLFGAFWVYSGVSIVGLFFVCCAVPETRGVELEEMEHHSTTTSTSASSRNGDTNNSNTNNPDQKNQEAPESSSTTEPTKVGGTHTSGIVSIQPNIKP